MVAFWMALGFVIGMLLSPQVVAAMLTFIVTCMLIATVMDGVNYVITKFKRRKQRVIKHLVKAQFTVR